MTFSYLSFFLKHPCNLNLPLASFIPHSHRWKPNSPFPNLPPLFPSKIFHHAGKVKLHHDPSFLGTFGESLKDDANLRADISTISGIASSGTI